MRERLEIETKKFILSSRPKTEERTTSRVLDQKIVLCSRPKKGVKVLRLEPKNFSGVQVQKKKKGQRLETKKNCLEFKTKKNKKS